jgi:hypothetical protein
VCQELRDAQVPREAPFRSSGRVSGSTIRKVAPRPALDSASTRPPRASTTANARTGTISDTAWTATPIQLVSQADLRFISSGQTPSGAVPSSLSPDGASFEIDWQPTS